MFASDKKRNSESYKWIVLSAILLGTAGVVVWRIYQKPLTAREVALRAVKALETKDADMLLALSQPSERDALKLDRNKMVALLDRAERLAGGKLTCAGEPFFEQASNALSATQTYSIKDSDRQMRVQYLIGQTDEGNKVINVTSTLFLAPVIAISQGDNPIALSGKEKAEKMLWAYQSARPDMEACGLIGTYNSHDQQTPVRTWAMLEEKAQKLYSNFAQRE